MASIERMINYLLQPEREGGFNPTLDGGTNFGISKRFNPDIDVANLDRARAADLWRSRYLLVWDKAMSFSVWPQGMANKITDLLCPDNNVGKAVRVLQGALNSAGLRPALVVDGIMGPKTRDAVKRVALSDGAVLAAMRSEIAGEYRLEAERHPSKRKYLKTWLRRSYDV